MTTMLDIPTKTTSRQASFARITDIREGRVTFDAAMARHVLDGMLPDFQRRSEKGHIDVLAREMRVGQWNQGRQICFGRLHGRLFLVDGQHRMLALIQSGTRQQFDVLITDVPDDQSLRELFRFHNTLERKRTAEQVLNALGVAESQLISKKLAKAVFASMGFILNDMRTPNGSATLNATERKSIDGRLEAASPFWHGARAYQACLNTCKTKGLSNKLQLSAVVAVALQTFRYQPELAAIFWGKVARNDGLRSGDAAHTLVTFLLVANDRGSGDGYMGACAVAWNAFRGNRSLTIIRPTMPIVLKGTPVGSEA